MRDLVAGLAKSESGVRKGKRVRKNKRRDLPELNNTMAFATVAPRSCLVAPCWRSPMWRSQAEAEGLTLLKADNKAGSGSRDPSSSACGAPALAATSKWSSAACFSDMFSGGGTLLTSHTLRH